eukprot:PhF_6_TR959/c0_g1_i2/m.1798
MLRSESSKDEIRRKSTSFFSDDDDPNAGTNSTVPTTQTMTVEYRLNVIEKTLKTSLTDISSKLDGMMLGASGIQPGGGTLTSARQSFGTRKSDPAIARHRQSLAGELFVSNTSKTPSSNALLPTNPLLQPPLSSQTTSVASSPSSSDNDNDSPKGDLVRNLMEANSSILVASKTNLKASVNSNSTDIRPPAKGSDQSHRHSFRRTGVFLPDSIVVTCCECIFLFICVVELIYICSRIGMFEYFRDSPPDIVAIVLLSCASGYSAFMTFLRSRVAILYSWNLIDSPATIWHHYRSTWFLFDLFTTIPLDLLLLFVSPDAFTWGLFQRSFRAVRILQLFSCTNPLVPDRNIRRVTLLLSFMWWGNCIAACIWLFLNSPSYLSRGFSSHYVVLTALYWSVQTTTSVGYGDVTHAEGDFGNRLLNCILMVVGVGAYSYLIGYLSAKLMHEDSMQTAVREKKERLNAVMEYYSVPWEVQKQAFSLYPRLVEGASINYSEVVDGLPPFMQEQMAYYVRTKLVSCVPMFKNAEAEILQEVCMVLEEEMVAPRQYIIRKGDKGNEMYFLAHGVVEVLGTSPEGDDIQLAILRDGSWFGEIALVQRTTRNASVRTVTACDILILSKDCFRKIVKKFPSSTFAQHIRKEYKKRSHIAGGAGGVNANIGQGGCSDDVVPLHPALLNLIPMAGSALSLTDSIMPNFQVDDVSTSKGGLPEKSQELDNSNALLDSLQVDDM